MNRTATVEVLTAEVRVLMVGSRQVTLSVFGQLDTIGWDDITPMGRVHPKTEGDWVIGADANGVLSRAKWTLDWPSLSWDEERSYKAWMAYRQEGGSVWTQAGVIHHNKPNDKGEPVFSQREDELLRAKDIIMPILGFVELIPGLQRHYREERARYHNLPLIVLAGLR